MVPEFEPLMRALIVTGMYPSAQRPASGSFVRDQVEALRRTGEVDLEVFAFAPGGAGAWVNATAAVRRRYRRDRFDIVHAHFGLSAWPGLAVPAGARAVTLHGTDLAHPRSRAITLAALRFYDLVAAVSDPLAHTVPSWAVGGETAVLPCGVDMNAFTPIPRTEARAALGLRPDGPHLLFPADPRRAEKRYDRALEVAGYMPLLALGGVDPADVPLWVNAANAVLVPSEREGFGLAVLEALACNVPVLATPTGIAPTVLDGLAGAHCSEFDAGRWRTALEPHLAAADPRIEGRERADQYSADRMAADVLAAWRTLR
jgi:glycosyltransferase involved in cell wall biosynthesis